MSRAERDKWDERYRSGSYAERTHPTAFLADHLAELPRGRALDVACGRGRNALHLAAHGYRVDAVDISPVALELAREAAAERSLTGLRFLEADLDENPDAALPDERYDLIVWVRYVNGALMAPLVRRLAPGGWLLCEQHLVWEGEVAGPASARFRLRPNELLRSFLAADAAGVALVRYYREGLVTDPDGRAAALAQLLGSAAA